MSRSVNTHGGGAATNANGLHFEQTTSLDAALINANYQISSDGAIYRNDQFIGVSKPKNKLKLYLKEIGVNINVNSHDLLPDEAFINQTNSTAYIIEKKFQNISGSVDEKLQTCGYKKQQYEKLFNQINIKTEYIYILNDWFNKPKYRDYFQYIIQQGCQYYFNDIPLDALGL